MSNEWLFCFRITVCSISVPAGAKTLDNQSDYSLTSNKHQLTRVHFGTPAKLIIYRVCWCLSEVRMLVRGHEVMMSTMYRECWCSHHTVPLYQEAPSMTLPWESGSHCYQDSPLYCSLQYDNGTVNRLSGDTLGTISNVHFTEVS